MININIRAIFTLENGTTIEIDSNNARKAGNLIPFMTISGVSRAGVTPIISLALANLPPDIISKLSIINRNTEVTLEAGYNDTYVFIASGSIYVYPEIQSTDNNWIWTADIVPKMDVLNEIDYSRDFPANTTWGEVMETWFTPKKIPIDISDSIRNQFVGAKMSLNIMTFYSLQAHFNARNFYLDYLGGTIGFSNLSDGTIRDRKITPNQIKPNQYLDFQGGQDAILDLVAWIPSVSSSMTVELTDESSVTTLGTVSGFSGTMSVLQSAIMISTEGNPTHQLTLRPLIENG